ncbi:MAG: hypothetical protein AAF283_00820 [Cyanobacteria bacterium P01_A01_bin.70]
MVLRRFSEDYGQPDEAAITKDTDENVGESAIAARLKALAITSQLKLRNSIGSTFITRSSDSSIAIAQTASTQTC